jgi:hypothetical protein
MLLFHGTSDTGATAIVSGKVDVLLGGGELGRGFYTGNQFHEAKAWAVHKHSRVSHKVVTIDVEEPNFFSLDVVALSAPETMAYRNNIRRAGATRTHVFSCDVVWAPIMGTGVARGDQHKWESTLAEQTLNGPKTKRAVKP